MLRKFSAYKRTGGWIAKDIIHTTGRKLIGVVLLSAAHVSAQILSIGIFIVVIQSLVSGDPQKYNILNYSVVVDASVGWVSLILAFGILTALLIYIDALYKNRVASGYSLIAMARILKKFSQPDPSLSDLCERERLSKNGTLNKLMMSGTSYITRATLSLLSTFMPIMMLMVTIPILVFISWEITLFIPVLLLIYALPYFLLNRKLVRVSRSLEESSGQIRLKTQNLINMLTKEQYGGSRNSNAQNDYLNSDVMRARFSNLQFIRTVSNALQGLNSLFLVVFMVLIISVAKYSSSENILIELFAYTVVMLQAFAALNKLTSYATIFNRFLPRIERYAEALRPISKPEKTEETPSKSTSPYPVFRIGKEQACAEGGLEIINLKEGMVCAVMGAKPLSAPTADIFLNELGGSRAFRSVRPFIVFADPVQAHQMSVRELLTLPEQSDQPASDNLTQLLSTQCISQEISDLPQGLETNWADIAPTISPTLKFAVSITPGLARHAKVIMVPCGIWQDVSREQLDEMRNSINGIVWLLVCDNQNQLMNQSFDSVVLSAGSGVVWIGTELPREEVLMKHHNCLKSFKQTEKQSANMLHEDNFD